LPLIATAAAVSCGAQPQPDAGGPAPLSLERTIPLPGVAGRIDHLAYDAHGHRLFVAELGSGTVEAIDLPAGRVTGRIAGVSEPQGVAWLENVGELAVASGDGTLRFYNGDGLRPVATMNLGDDADNLRVEPGSGALAVGFGSGAIAMIDPVRHVVLRSLALPAHPEGFRLDGDRVYVNVPNAGRIVAGDLSSGTLTASWSTGLRRLNFPMAFEPASRTLAVTFRFPSRLVIVDPSSGDYRQVLVTCGDSDDLFFDTARRRLYVVCGSGDIDVFQTQGGNYALVARLSTRSGARTGLFVPEEDRLFVAARSQGNEPAAILVFRPQP
jgi:DNA-binding beta-propeller fold protein YncE